MPISSGDKMCPICDSPLTPGSKKCSFCGTDLSIFDIEVESPKPAIPAHPRATLESRVDEVLSKPPPPPAFRMTEPTPAPAARPAAPQLSPPKPAVSAEPPKKAPAPSPIREAKPPVPSPIREVKPPAPEPQPKAEYFECPECGSSVEMNAAACPKCGVMFAEEGTEMFQCPACNTLVDVNAKTCPGCGAMFVEPEEVEESQKPKAPEKAAAKFESVPFVESRPAPPVPKREMPSEKPKAEPKLEEKRGLFGSFFKRGKKEEEEAEPEAEPARPPIREAAPAPKPSPPPKPKEMEMAPAPVVRPERPPPAEPVAKDKGKDLARMVAEMKPLLALAREREVDIGESKQLIDEAAMAGRERQLDKAIELVLKSKVMLMAKIDAGLAQEIAKLNEETKVAREFGGDTSRALTYVQEIARARSSGDVEAAYVYVDKAKNELQPITGRYNELRSKLSSMKQLVTDCEVFIVDSRDARSQLVEASRAFEVKDFDKTENLLKAAQDKLYKNIPPRMNEEMRKARDELVNAKMKNVNISPMITVLKSATSSMKAGDYPQALKDMREFREMMKKVG